jgi:hypothetical protein
MIVNFRARGISRGARKLVRTPTLNKKKKGLVQFHFTREILKMNGSAPNDGNINTCSILYVLHDVRKIVCMCLHH